MRADLVQIDLPGDQIDDGLKVLIIAKTPGLALGILNDAIQALKRCVGVGKIPVVEDFRQMPLESFGELEHGSQLRADQPVVQLQ